MKKIVFCLFLFFGLFACSRTQLLNMQKHEFSVQPKHIVWVQIPGLNEEHLAMLRFALVNNEKKTALESMECFGKLWTYNFYQLRPSSSNGFMAQIVGKDDIKGSCQDYRHKPLWKTFEDLSYRTYILEANASKEDSLLRSLDCPVEGAEFLKEVSFYSMGKAPKKDSVSFHHQDKLIQGLDRPGIFYDRSCQEGSCFSSLTENARLLFQRMSGDKRNYLFILRDFVIESYLKNSKISEMRDSLSELEKLISYFRAEAQKDPQMLIVVSSSASRPIEYPEQGVSWMEFENQGKNILYKKTALTAPVFSFGAGAENFCGFYSEADMLNRLLWFKTSQDLKGMRDWF